MSLTKNYRILLIDDDRRFCGALGQRFRQHYIFEGAYSIGMLDEMLLKGETYDLILLDLVLDEENPKEKNGLDQIEKIQHSYSNVPIIVITNDMRDAPAIVTAFKAGVKDVIFKSPVNFDLWEQRFRTAIENSKTKQENIQLRAQVKRNREHESRAHRFIGESQKIKDIKKTLEAISTEPNITVLLTGETGVGKEIAARYLHQHGARADKPFQAVNLSMIQDSMLESRLFGHKKGAFTGADRDLEGYFAQTDTGVLMLDEIGEINKELQVKFLRFLEDKTIRPLGGNKDIQLDIQIVTATNRDLTEEVQKGNFREDLFYRINGWTVKIPPLRERKEDIPLIIKHYLEGVAPEQLIEKETLFKLLDYNWPGNIRQLKNAVEYMTMQRRILDKFKIDIACLPDKIQEYQAEAIAVISPLHPTSSAPKSYSYQEEKVLIDLKTIESHMMIKNKVKKDVAREMNLSLDKLRYKIETLYEKFPHLFSDFSYIREAYPKLFK